MTVCGSPVSAIAFFSPSAIDSTPMNTTTTPQMPIMATIEEPRRSLIDRMLTPVTAMICERAWRQFPPQRFDDSKPLACHAGIAPAGKPRSTTRPAPEIRAGTGK